MASNIPLAREIITDLIEGQGARYNRDNIVAALRDDVLPLMTRGADLSPRKKSSGRSRAKHLNRRMISRISTFREANPDVPLAVVAKLFDVNPDRLVVALATLEA